ncbi:spore coat protein GerQ [Bacillus benzoevorans]|uniref:Spore coat protein GerQ n=1 Tax=Bacillus benzoevorans TaxID=1456 RepID=A0A7X0HRD0_9BACI|nr:spore coat protein GerQ [Bacillus benzoevorans]MBB6445523.1 spore germination protein Q [Bacillus benzoevorans]
MSQSGYGQYGGYQPYSSYGYSKAPAPYYGGPAAQMPAGGYPPLGTGAGGMPPAGTGGFPPVGAATGGGAAPTTGVDVPGMLPTEQSYIENILRLNKGKLVNVYTTFENNKEWNAKIFRGLIEAAGRDHLIISDPQSGARYLIPMVYLDYVQFDEEIEYEYPFGSSPGLATYPPR